MTILHSLHLPAGTRYSVAVSPQLGIDKSGKMGADAREQVEIAFENVEAALPSVGATFEHVVKLNNYIVDIGTNVLQRHIKGTGQDGPFDCRTRKVPRLMPERLKLRHKVTGEEKGPFLGWYPADWFPLWATNEYDFIRSSDCYDKNSTEIFEGDMVSYVDGWPVQIVDHIGRVGYYGGDYWDRTFIEVTPEWSAYAEVVGRDGVLFSW